jgi:predicted ArsR family transcriptional regulator
MLDAALAAVPRVRRTDPGTSHEAASRTAEFAGDQQSVIRRVLANRRELGLGPLGAEEIGDAMGVPAYAIRKRLSELNRDGFIMPVGERKTRSGRTERTWEALW